jgi:hypothetical protein
VCGAVKTTADSTSASHTSSPAMVFISDLSAKRAPTRLPATMPTPNSASTSGTPSTGMPVTSVSSGLM